MSMQTAGAAATQDMPQRAARSLEARLGITVAASLLLLIAAIAAAILVMCHGHLTYSLDDPYISLALSDHIAHGHYGINATEAASPSSSIIYPLLLALFAWAPWQDWVPLVLDGIAACAVGVLIAREFCRSGIVAGGNQIAAATASIVGLCLAINIVGLVFTGLEHSLHVLASIFVVFGLARVLESGTIPRGLVVAIVLLPLLRFEGMALALLALLMLAAAGHWRAAIVAALSIGAALGLYMAAMAGFGLPILPSSVLVKSDLARQTVEGASGLASIWRTVSTNLHQSIDCSEAYPLFLLLGLTLAHPLLRASRLASSAAGRLNFRDEILFVTVIAGALVAHVLFGAWGWFARYEIYAVAIGVGGCIVLWRDTLIAAMRRPVVVTIGILAMLCIGYAYVLTEAVTPISSLAIHEQQYQMRRFAVDFYRRPVGVNDIGWVSYRNPNYVLDLWGLGSEAARLRRSEAGSNPFWMQDLVTMRQIGLVMIFDEWFPGQIPPGWRRIATLRSAHRITSPSDTVSFYATSDSALAPAMAALHAFAGHVGEGATLTIFDNAAQARLSSAGH